MALLVCVTNSFGSTLGSIGIVTGLGVMLGMFMYESGGIDSIVDKVLKAVGPKRTQCAVSVAGFITGIPVFGDVVYIMFAPMLRVLSRKTGYSMAAYGGALAVNVGVFFFYALIAAFIGMFMGGIVYGGIVNRQDQKAGKTWDFSNLDTGLAERDHSENDVQYHAAIAKCTHNLVAPKLIPIITYAITLFVLLTESRLKAQTLVDHREILDAICGRDGPPFGGRKGKIRPLL